MSDVVAGAVSRLAAKVGPQGFDGHARFEIEGEGALVIDAAGVRAESGTGGEAGEDADVTLTASRETFEAILAGELAPTSAFMSGRLKIAGDMGAAMRLGTLLG